MYRRGQIGISVDPVKKQVKFVWPEGHKTGQPMLGVAEKSLPQVKRGINVARDLHDVRAEAEQELVACEPHFEDGCLVMRNVSRKNLNAFFALQKGVMFDDYDFYDPDTDLHGFKVSELDQFFWAMRALSMAQTFVLLKQFMEKEREFKKFQFTSTQIMQTSAFKQVVCDLSGLTKAKVSLIIDRLTYDARTSSPCVFQQPFFVTANEVCWSPALIQKSAYRRNMLRLMARTPALKATADNVIGERETMMLQRLKRLVSASSKCQLNTTIESGGEKTEIDLLAYNPAFPKQLLIIEGKAVLPADEINEVDAATKEMMRGQKQIETGKRILQRMSLSEKKRIFPIVNWNAVNEYFGIVVTPDTEPHQGLDHSTIPAMSLLSLTENMSEKQFACPSTLWRRARDRPWLSDMTKYKSGSRQICVGDLSSFLPIVYSDDSRPDQIQEKFMQALSLN